MKIFGGSLLVVVASLLLGVAADPTKPVPWKKSSVASSADPTKPVPWVNGVAADPTKAGSVGEQGKVADLDDPTKPVPWKKC